MTSDAPVPALVEPPSRRPVWQILLGVALTLVVLILVAVWFAGRSWAHGTLDDYERAAKRWDAGFGTSILKGTDHVPESAYVTRRPTSAEAEMVQRRGCSETEGVLRNFRQGSRQLPVVDAGVAGWFSADLRAADRSSHERQRAVRAYARKATKVFEQVRVDCEWNADVNAPSVIHARVDRLLRKARTYTDPVGTVTGPYQCYAKGGCVSASKERRRKQAALQRQAFLLERKEGLSGLGASCRATSYGPEVCRVLATSVRDAAAAGLHAASVLRSLDRPDDPRIDTLAPGLRKAARIGKERARAVLKKQHPEAWRVKEIRTRYTVSSLLLRFEDRRLVASLRDDRRALARLVDVRDTDQQVV